MRRGYSFSDDEKKDDSNRWLLTYSDMITLLLALFIILYGMSSLNTGKFEDISKGLQKALNNEGTQMAGPESSGLNDVYQALNQYISSNDLTQVMSLSYTGNSVTIHLKDTILFTPGTAKLQPDSIPVLQEIANAIKTVYNSVEHIVITGNTADLGHRDAANEADSWQLSVDRAVSVLNRMSDTGLAPDKLSIEGNSHYRPIASNDTEDGRAQNRRVEITIKGS